jgi:hypothetical protein
MPHRKAGRFLKKTWENRGGGNGGRPKTETVRRTTDAVETIERTSDPFADSPIHRTAGGTTVASDMPLQSEQRWTAATLRFNLIHIAITSVVAVAFAYGSYAVTTNALATKIDTLEKTVINNKAERVEQVAEIKADLKTEVVTKEVLELTLRPIRDQQIEQLKLLNEIRTFQIRNSAANP